MDVRKEYELLEKLYFERIGGTEEELKACKIIQDELKEIGLESTIEEFEVVKNDVHEVVLEVLEPYQKTYEATAYSDCADGELECELCYFEMDNDVLRREVKDKVALVNGYLGMRVYKAIAESGAKGFITFNGNIDMEENDLDPRELRKPLHEFGVLPGVNMRVEDAMEMVDKKATKVRIVTKQTVSTSMSHNLVCDIKGESDDVIVLTAHYDSVPYSKGAYDNATGSVGIFAIANELKDKKLKHSLRFVWCGSEERGLLGSKAYVRDHKEELDNIKLCINIDMIGNTMGSSHAVCTSEEAFVHYLEYHSRMVGFPLGVKQGVYSSDSTPFADAGIPAVSFARWAAPGTGAIHSRVDVIEHISERILGEDTEYICKVVEDLANAYMIPVKKEIPQNMKDEIFKYYGKDLLKKEDK